MNAPPPDASILTSPTGTLLVTIALLSLAPFLLTVITSFAKILIVSSIVRQAIGIQGVPPTSVLTGIALVLTAYTTAPLAFEIYSRAQSLETAASSPADQHRPTNETAIAADAATTADRWWRAARDPLGSFLAANASERNTRLFRDMWADRTGSSQASDAWPAALRDEINVRFIWLVPAFMLTELTEALVIGFLILTPFLVIDLVVGNILLAVGMQFMTPNTISLPLKLLLFVLMDGWTLIYRGLIESYPMGVGGGG